MLEDIALDYVNQPESSQTALNYGLMILGGVIAGITSNEKAEIARAPYFAYAAAITLAVIAAQAVWLQSLPAISGGYLWVLMVVSIATWLIGGFFYCRIAMARSRDAYGHGRMAVLAFIPFANLWLLAKPSKNEISANRAPTISLLTGRIGVLSGFVMLIATGIVNAVIDQALNHMVERAQTEPVSQRAIESMIRSNGLEETLSVMTSGVQTPVAVDELTILSRIEVEGSQLRRTYVVDLEGARITDQFRAGVANAICSHNPFIPLLRAGATFREVYVQSDSTPIGAVMVTRNECGF